MIDGEFAIPKSVGLRPGLYHVQVFRAADGAADSCTAEPGTANTTFLITIRSDGANQLQLGD